MSQSAFVPQEKREVFMEILLAAGFGVALFVILTITTGGFVLSLATAAVMMVLFGLLHYLIWGQALLKSVAHEREAESARSRLQVAQAKPADEFMLALDEQERAVFMEVLEQSLVETHTSAHQSPQANRRWLQRRETIKVVLEKLRGYGA